MDNYHITYHAVERLKERFGAFYSRIPDLKSWKREQGLGSLKTFFNRMVEASVEDKSYLNNTKQMVFLYEKYGYDTDYKFYNFQEADIVFVFAKERSMNDFKMVTLMPSAYKPVVNHIKHGKVSKEERLTLFVNNWNSRGSKKTTSVDTSPLIIPVESNIKDSLIKSKTTEKATLLSQISQTVSLNRTKVDNKEYDFYYSSTDKTVEIKSSRELTVEEVKKMEDDDRLLKIIKQLKNLYLSNKVTTLDKVNGEVSLYEVQIDDYIYKFEYNKNTNNILIADSNKIDGALLKDYELQQESTVDLKNKLLKNIAKDDCELVKTIDDENVLMKSNVKDYKYEFVYNTRIKSIELQNKEKLIGEELETYLLQKELTPPLLDTIKKLIHYNQVQFVKRLTDTVSLNKVKNKDNEYEFTFNRTNNEIELVSKMRI